MLSLFNRPQAPPYAASPYPVPDTETLRQRALAASWKRDRGVGRRRIAWRWTLWALGRYVVPAVALAAAGFATWHWLVASPAPPASAADSLQLKPTLTLPKKDPS